MTSTFTPAKAQRSGGAVALIIVGWVLAFLGVVNIAVFYISQGALPIAALGSWNILAGLLWVVVGCVLIFISTRMKPKAQVIGTASAGQLNGLALASIIVVWFMALVGLILGHIALSQIARTGEQGRGLALTAVIVGWVELVLAVLVGVWWLTVMMSLA